MNILIISPGFQPVPAFNGGAIEGLIQTYLESNVSNNIVVYSIIPDKKYKIDMSKYKNVEFRYISMDEFEKYKYIKMIKKDIIKRKEVNKFDAVIIENTSIYAVYLRKIFKGKIILHLHNDYLNKETKLAKIKYMCCDEIWCVSQFIADRVNEINIRNKKALVLYNGINISKFNKANLEQKKLKEIKEKYAIPDNGKIFIYTGRIMKEKGVLELIKAFKRLQHTNRDIYLLIVGGNKNNTNNEDLYLKSVYEENGENVIFTGIVNNTDIPYYYGIANYQIVPSLWNEAFGLVIIEGMACGLPIIATKVGGIPELVNSSNGILINKENIVDNLYMAMQEMLVKNSKEYEKKAILTAERFDEKIYVNKIEELLDNFRNKKLKITLFSEYTKTDLNAGPKAKVDVEKILLNKYNTNIVFLNYKLNNNKLLNVFYKVKKAVKILFNSDRKSIAVIQFPFVQRGYSLFKNYKKVIILVHDIEGLRRKNEELLKKEINFFNKADCVILHNEKMKEILIKKGLTNKNIIILELFDYLCENKENENILHNMPTIVYAGNLKKEKSPFIYQIDDNKIGFKLNLYGVGLEKDISTKITYKGSFLPDKLPNKLEGSLGLVWDGDLNENDEESGFKQYTKYNNPHKLSCYISAGMPVIVWEKAAVANLVKKYNIGYTIKNIYDINKINFADYDEKKANVKNLKKNVIEGYYILRAINCSIEKEEI